MTEDIIKELIRALPALLTLALVFMQRTKLETVHMLVNSSYGAALALNTDNAEARAEESKKAVDIKAAKEARRLLELHLENQAAVDAKGK